MPRSENLDASIGAYLDANWHQVLADLDTLVHIDSVEDLGAAAPGAPFGPGPRAALSAALDIAARMGLETHDCEGYLGYADLPGVGPSAATQVGIIGHVDVVPAGPGWTVAPRTLTRKEGYLLGRGVADDKGPVVVALHAVNFWREHLAARNEHFPYTLRFLFGANEETNMKDVAYYRARFADPAFLFTPDAEFPVAYGEAGICSGTLASPPLGQGALRDLRGGVAVNAVPGEARAVLRSGAVVEAHGKAAHASTPNLGESAIKLLAEKLLACADAEAAASADELAPSEHAFLELVHAACAHTDGSGLGVACEDAHFGALTAVGGTIHMEGERILLSLDFRYPTTTTAAEIERRVQAAAARACPGATFTMEHDKEPFLVEPDSPTIQALLSAYNEATGEDARPFTMKGGTYARMFTTAASFGPEKPWEEKPAWVGAMHGPDEGISEELLKQAFSIYVRTIGNLMQLEL